MITQSIELDEGRVVARCIVNASKFRVDFCPVLVDALGELVVEGTHPSEGLDPALSRDNRDDCNERCCHLGWCLLECPRICGVD